MDAEVRVAPGKIQGVSTLAQLECALTRPDWNEVELLKIKNIDLSQLSVPFTFPANALDIEIKNCTLTVCPALPEGLLILRLDRNAGLTELPALPATLQKLFCRHTGLTHLPQLPESLVTLGVSNCQLQDSPGQPAIPNFPNSLIYIDIQHNRVGALPAVSTNLRTLNVSNNQIQYIPALPDTLVRFFCANNQLRVFPLLPEDVNLHHSYFENNPLEAPYSTYFETWKTEHEAAMTAYHASDFTDVAHQRLMTAIREAEQKFRTSITQEKARTRQQGRNTQAVNLALSRSLLTSRQHGGPADIVASFLSGTSGAISKQMEALQKKVQGGGRHTRRKGRKGKRSSTR